MTGGRRTRAPLAENERRDWLRLARAENVGPVAFSYLIDTYGEAAQAIGALPRMAERAGRAHPPRVPTPAEAQSELDAGSAIGAKLICSCESAFPPLLAALDPPPPLIWTRGDAGLLHGRAVAVVGARIASAAGQRFARTLAHELGEAGYIVVSGLARGIDGAAHEGSLATGAVAVLGGGPDDVYPAEHADLYRRIVAKGCVVSESPPGYRAQARDFPRRNRLISGLALGVVVVEAELRSGSLITARLAGEQGREVFAVPGSPMDARAKGTNDLIRQGAALCEGAEDVIRTLEGIGAGMREPGPPAYVPQGAGEPDTKLLKQIEDLLSPTPTAWDELARAAGAPGPLTYAALVELSLAGRAELLPGGMAVSA
ncbi:MAG: dprA protein [Caulobacteraceae bacterium]|nr:dprA protein [Caulobacteraceae bacterium]